MRTQIDIFADALPAILPLLQNMGMKLVGSAKADAPETVRLVFEGGFVPDAPVCTCTVRHDTSTEGRSILTLDLVPAYSPS